MNRWMFPIFYQIYKIKQAIHDYKIKHSKPMNYFRKIKGIAKSDGIPERLSTFIDAQCVHETTYKGKACTSIVFKNCNNLNGYKYCGSKWQISACTDSPEGNAYGKYETWQDSVHELTDWIRRRFSVGRFPMLQNIRTP